MWATTAGAGGDTSRRSRWSQALVAVALVYAAAHFWASGVRGPLSSPNLGKFDEQTPALSEYLQSGTVAHVLPMQYGPTFFFVMHPLLRVTNGDRERLSLLLYGLQIVCLGLGFALTCATLRRVETIPNHSWPVIAGWLAVLWLNFTPLYSILVIKSVETWELLLIALALYAHVRRWPVVTAGALAAAGLIKILPFVFVAYLLLTERRAFVYSLAAVAVVLLASHAIYGAEMGLAYLPHHTGSSLGFSYGLNWHENVSLKAAIAKAFGHLDPEGSRYVDFTRPQLTAAILVGDFSLVSGVALLARALLAQVAPRSPRTVLWEWSLVACAILILSPNTTIEYAVLALGAASYALVRLLTAASPSRATWACFAGAMFLLGGILPRSLLTAMTLSSAIGRWRGYTALTPTETYQYVCFPLAGLALLTFAVWRLKPQEAQAS
jgi:hypothetical protein